MRKQTVLQIGSISEGTMRPEDLVPSFLWELEALCLTRGERQEVCAIRKASSKASNEDEDEDNDYWDEQASWDLDALIDMLNAHCPDYCYFGASDGDPADYGCWVLWDCLADAVRNGDMLSVDDLADIPRGYNGDALLVNDHGNTTLYHVTRGRLREVWAIV